MQPGRENSSDSGGGAERSLLYAADLALVRSVLRRDRVAIDAFVVRMRCVPRFVTLLQSRAGAPTERSALEDHVQDVIATVWRRLEDYRGEARLETWVFRICDYQLRNARRRASYRETLPLHEVREVADAGRGDAMDDDLDELQRGLDALEATEALVIRLKHFSALTFDEIGTKLKVSPSTVKTRYYRGMTALRRALTSKGQNDG